MISTLARPDLLTAEFRKSSRFKFRLLLLWAIFFGVGGLFVCLRVSCDASSVSLKLYSPRKRVVPKSLAVLTQGNPQRCLTLWERVGCYSKHPILLCTPFPNTTEERYYHAVVKTFDSLVHLNVCRHDNCSLVGSSGNLKNHQHGNLIDKCNIVIRLNNQPIKGYEKYVGKRPADIMIFNNHIDCFTNISHPTLYVRAPDNALRKDSVIIKKCQADRLAPLYSMSKYIQQQSQVLLKAYAERFNIQREVYSSSGNYIHATSGFKALIFSMMISRQVHVFGFGMQGAKTWHYYPPHANYYPLHHEMSLEMKIIQDIAKETLNSTTLDLQNNVFGRITVY